MSFGALTSSSTSILGLAQSLGEQCLEGEAAIASLRAHMGSASVQGRLDAVLREIAALPIGNWLAMQGAHDFSSLASMPSVAALTGAMERWLRRMPHLPAPIVELAVLRAMCDRVLRDHYSTFTGELHLDRGTPFPLPREPRDLRGVFSSLTPLPETMGQDHLLDDVGFRLFRHPATDRITVTLDFSAQDELDAATWDPASRRLPPMATVHPHAPGNVQVGSQTPTAFFDVGPTSWSPGDVIDLLRAAKQQGATCAVLPELSLPDPDALDTLIEASFKDLPSLIVAGSAHRRFTNGTLHGRSNECVTYLNGGVLMRHSKIHLFRTALEAGGAKLAEDFTHEPKVLRVAASAHTRLATVICADLNDLVVAPLLASVGVNVLLVPSLTDSMGAFKHTTAAVCGNSQGVAVIANGTLGAPQPPPFMTLVATPAHDLPHAEFTDPKRVNVGIVEFGPPVTIPMRPEAVSLRWLF